MKVHIVHNPADKTVIGRMMTALSRTNEWSMSNHLDLEADINYIGLYLHVPQKIRNSDYQERGGKVAAWFSHYEDGTPHKMELWNNVAKRVDIRTTSALQYFEMLEPYGETHLVTPPIDRQFYQGSLTPKTIGVSGFVYTGGRKGESLLQRLYRHSSYVQSGIWALKASGRGWDIPNLKYYEWDEMPDFYKSLDVYLVTSDIEGIPMTALEALACNVPVVAPKGVGLLSELSSPHIYYYDKNTLSSLDETLLSALYPSLSVVNKYNNYSWAKNHKDAFGVPIYHHE